MIMRRSIWISSGRRLEISCSDDSTMESLWRCYDDAGVYRLVYVSWRPMSETLSINLIEKGRLLVSLHRNYIESKES